MIVVIIAGGSGTRLWPLSTDSYPKHLLNITGEESLVQATLRRAKQLAPVEKIYIVTDASHAHHIQEQLQEVPAENFLIEPDRRDTAGCFVVALSRIQQKHDLNEAIAFVSADHYIRDTQGFTRSFKIAAEASEKNGRICLVGIEPLYPASGFGYIKKDGALDQRAPLYKVAHFKEKPDAPTAMQYIESGNYLWNAGYFVGSVHTFLTAMSEFAPELKDNYTKLVAAHDEQSYTSTFLSFEKISIDYALIEKVSDLMVLQASFDWADLGSFKDIYEVVSKDENANYTHGPVNIEAVENTFIQNTEIQKPIIVIGVDNLVIVNTPEGVLVVRKDLSQQVKPAVQKMLKEQQAKD